MKKYRIWMLAAILDKVEGALKHGIVGISRRVCILQNRKKSF